MIKRLFALAALLLLGATPDAVQARPVADVPMLFYGTRPAVEVMVDGQGPFLFLIDTGAGGQARADTTLVKRLGLKVTGQSEAVDITGRPGRQVDEVRLKSIRLGAVEFNDVLAQSRNYNTATYLPEIAGILGIELFEPYLLTLDYPRRRVRIETGALPPPDGRTVLPFVKDDGVAFITLRIGGRPVRTLVDSANIRGLDLSSSQVKAFALAGYPTLIGKGGSVSGEFDLKQVELQDEVMLGAHRIDPAVVTFSDTFNEANMGSTWLRRFAVTLDQQNGRIRFAEPQRPR